MAVSITWRVSYLEVLGKMVRSQTSSVRTSLHLAISAFLNFKNLKTTARPCSLEEGQSTTNTIRSLSKQKLIARWTFNKINHSLNSVIKIGWHFNTKNSRPYWNWNKKQIKKTSLQTLGLRKMPALLNTKKESRLSISLRLMKTAANWLKPWQCNVLWETQAVGTL